MRCWPYFPKLSTEPNLPVGGGASSHPPHSSPPPALQRRFRVGERIGSGATGVLYQAEDTQTQQRGVLKLLQFPAGSHAAERRRVQRELGKQAALDRQHLVAPLAYGEADGMVWLFRDWVGGESLRERIDRQGRLSLDEALGVAMQAAAALDELHRGGLLHRDLKPGHILLRPREDGVDHAFVIDAGIAARIDTDAVFELMGTPAYVSPEHVGGKLVSFRSDLYALGCVLFEMLTGRPPYVGERIEEVLSAHREQPVPEPDAELPAQVASLLASLLAKEPRERPFSAQQVRRGLQPFAPTSTPRTQATAGVPAGVVAQARQHASRPAPGSGRSMPPPAPAGRAGASMPPPPPKRSVPPPTPKRSMPPSAANGPHSVPPPPPAAARAGGKPSMPPPPPGGFDRDAHTGVIDDADLLDVESGEAPPERAAEQTQALTDADLAEAAADVSFSERQSEPASAEGSAEPEDSMAANGSAEEESTRVTSMAALQEASARPDLDEEPDIRGQPLDGRDEPRSNPAESHAEAPEAADDRWTEDRTQVLDASDLQESVPDEPPKQAAASEPAAQAAERTAAGAEQGGQAAASEPAGMEPPPAQPAVSHRPSQGAAAPDEPQATGAPPASQAVPTSAPPSSSAPPPRPRPSSVPPPPPRSSSAPPHASARGEQIWDDQPEDDDDEMPTIAIPRSSVPHSDAPPAAARARRRSPVSASPRPGTKYSLRTVGIAAGAVLVVGIGLIWALAGEDEPDGPQVVVTSGQPSSETAAASGAASEDDEPAQAATAETAAAEEEGSAGPSSGAEQAVAAEVASDDAAEEEGASEKGSAKEEKTAQTGAKAEEEAEKARDDREVAEREQGDRAERGASRQRSRRASRPDPEEVRAAAREAYRKGNYRKAANLYDRATELQPSHAGSFAGLGASLLAMGRARPALNAYQRALRLNPQSSGFHAALGRAYFTLGDRARAIAAYRKAVQLNPNNAVAQQALQRILRQK